MVTWLAAATIAVLSYVPSSVVTGTSTMTVTVTEPPGSMVHVPQAASGSPAIGSTMAVRVADDSRTLDDAYVHVEGKLSVNVTPVAADEPSFAMTIV